MDPSLEERLRRMSRDVGFDPYSDMPFRDPALRAEGGSSDPATTRLAGLYYINIVTHELHHSTLATLVEQVKKLEQLLPQLKSRLEDNASETSGKESLKESPSKQPKRSARRSTRNQRRPSAASSWVKIGEGVTLKKKQLEKIWKQPSLTATKFARQLCKAVFTRQELQGKCLKKTSRTGNREVLDPIRLNAIIGYTCSKFNTDRRTLRLAIAYMLCHLNERTTPRSY
ncbi:uncharacterized protein LOC125759475 [Rhipicephalus sanguineus]|uniref:uncharacterized protein LOC125759475 n=1 Tax=Rhipicephalus sanguineus TaxID=34632 RepID=UPI0020C527CF|nr:uncharacterized protein LOC125759475 [Rhipicephalus sanguineus]